MLEEDSTHFLFAKTPLEEWLLHVACRIGLSSITVQWLVNAMSNQNSVDKYRKTPFHHAVIGGHIELIRLLLESGADIDLKDKQGDTALTLALKGKKRDVVVVLVEAANASPNYERTTPLHIAATDTAILLSELLEHRKLVKIDLNALNREGNSPLHLATLHGEVPNM